ncbi:MAG: aldo/keto reductase [Aminobacterium sp.]|jgi:predicted aldo/keto reductase-like oxidoreductase|uniref:aldo/keto reductase n=1 Tax=unclassified Aminobacterium TaxID=2685012 RepID=UPI001BCE765D|nr:MULTISPECIES: aldo/keto reductase [unclassified Aminobacterium]MDD2207262.1 aldo/keto reductase [Aminobacterium sp.]MDD3425260.1 aldo/keto reductase [Aminobacterium sp.]MDD3707775.1 aldo/keto reductase [Aminobacterium sp.]MDD4229168.1 aldo/keto reductase [Aminobacterium sp.]MDD4552033.1 aldo/keto reductase [Aminobacterium sp.]
MNYRTMPGMDEELSILGFGCMRLPLTSEGIIDEGEATKILRYAIDHGVNYVDTAWPYHNEMSEPFVGRALLDGYRDKVYLATKLPSWLVEKHEDMDSFLNEQLRRLQTKTIDFYLVHSLNRERWNNMVKNDVFSFLEKAIADGRIRHAGFSFHGEYELFEEILDAWHWEFCQIQYNYLDENYQAGTKGLREAASRGLGVIIMEPLRGGKLATNVPEPIQNLWQEAEEKMSPAAWGLRWVWNHSEVSVVLSGMNSLNQVRENIIVSEKGEPGTLSHHDLDIVEKVKNEYKKRMKVDCTNCRYCMPCPQGVNIPECFNRYNMAFMFDDEKMAKDTYFVFVKDYERASLCVECGACEEVCPQNLPIRQYLKDVVDLFEADKEKE